MSVDTDSSEILGNHISCSADSGKPHLMVSESNKIWFPPLPRGAKRPGGAAEGGAWGQNHILWFSKTIKYGFPQPADHKIWLPRISELPMSRTSWKEAMDGARPKSLRFFVPRSSTADSGGRCAIPDLALWLIRIPILPSGAPNRAGPIPKLLRI